MNASIVPDHVSRRRRTGLRRLGAVLLWLGLVAAALAAYSEWRGAEAGRAFPPQGEMSGVAGSRLHYRDLRPLRASRGTVVLIHGAWAGHADLLDALGPFLSDYRVIAIDRPGQGWSDRPGGWEIADPGWQADAIMRLLDRIAPERLVLVAHSLGGPLSTRIALERPDRLHGLVLLSAVTHPWLGDAARYHPLSTSLMLGPIFNRVVGIPMASFLLERSTRAAFAPQEVAPGYIEAAELPLLFREETFRGNLQDIVAADIFLRTQAPRHRQLMVPVVAITGDRDGFVSPAHHSAAIAREAPVARLIVLPGVGHMPHRARPDIVAEAVRELAQRP